MAGCGFDSHIEQVQIEMWFKEKSLGKNCELQINKRVLMLKKKMYLLYKATPQHHVMSYLMAAGVQ